MTGEDGREPSAPETAEATFRQAVEHHQAGRLPEAEQLYRRALEADPGHAVANHNLGAVAVQMDQPAAGLPHFLAALEADPTQGKYWLSYIDALIRADRLDDARQVLDLTRQQGLEGGEVEALAARLASPAVGSRTSGKPTKAGRKAAGRKSKEPAADEVNALITAFKQGHLAEAAALARAMTESYPRHWMGWKMLGVVFQQTGRNAEALAPMQKAVELAPQDAEAHNNLGIILKDLGRPQDSEKSYRRALHLDPNYALAHSNLGATLHDLGRLGEAAASYRQALKLKPDYAKAHNNLGATLHDLNRLAEAEACYRQALAIEPGYAEALSNLGNTLKDLGRLQDAEDCLRRALEIRPDFAEALTTLGIMQKDLGRMADAEASLRQAVEREPDSFDANYHLAALLYALDRLEDCCAAYRRALKLKPDDFDANCNLGLALRYLGRTDEAVATLGRALKVRPDSAIALSNLGIAYMDIGLMDQAEATLRHALQFAPNIADVHSNLGLVLMGMGRLVDAETSLRRAAELAPNAAKIRSNLGSVLNNLGRLDEAVTCYRQAMALAPDYAMAHSNLLHCLSQVAGTDARELFAEHCRFGACFETPLMARWRPFARPRDATRALRIGIVSGDLRDHAIAYFIEPILASLSRYPTLSLHAYANHVGEDPVTQRLRTHFRQWASVVGMTDDDAAQRIRADGIDVLIDLSGHTAKNRLLVFARKPAPLQATWMGFPGTTGLHSVDYFLSDRLFLPPGQFDDQFTEKIVRLPAGAPFLPSDNAPPVNALPALGCGHVTFGSFNRLSKLRPQVIALWSQLLRSLPKSRLLLGGMHEGDEYQVLIDWFAREGIARDRLDFHRRCGMDDYLRLHHQVDICLDTFPYNGGTTTLHALWMGVPTVSLAGGIAASQSGAAILGHAGLGDFVAHGTADYLDKGLSWASRPADLAAIRASTRDRLSASAMGQPSLIAAALERAFRIMWRRWCAGLPAESFEVEAKDIAVAQPEAGR